MEKIEAYKCGITGAIFGDPGRAARSEFRALMKQAGGGMPAMGSIAPSSITDWLAGVIEGEAYPNVIDKLIEALSYYENNRDVIHGKLPVSNGDRQPEGEQR